MPATPSTRRTMPVFALVLFGMTTAAWVARTVYLASHTPLWMDEVLTLWLLRLDSPPAIYRALAQGAQYTPPAYPDLLFLWAKIGGTGYLWLRIPSIFGGLTCAFSIFLLLRRYVPATIAATGFLLCLCPPFLVYDIQLRPYSLTLACLALVLLLWDDLCRRLRRLSYPVAVRLIVIAFLLAAGLALHIFFVFSIVTIGLIEIIFEARFRRFRAGIWIALTLGALTTLYWLPLIQRFRAFTAGDKGPLYAAAPKLGPFTVSVLSLSSQSIVFLLFLGLGAVLAIAARQSPRSHSEESHNLDVFPLKAIAFGLAAMPFVTFAIGLIFSGIYTTRYALPGALGAVLLTCLALHAWPLPAKNVIIPAAAFGTSLCYLAVTPKLAVSTDLKPVFASATRPYPLALAEPLIFFAQQEDRSITPEQRDRLVYYSLPAEFAFGDPTAERQLLRWKALHPALPVATLQSVLEAHQCFYLYDTFQTDHDITRYLQEHHVQPRTVTHIGNGYLGEFCP